MSRDKVQFLNGLSTAGLEAICGTDEQCRAVVIAS